MNVFFSNKFDTFFFVFFSNESNNLANHLRKCSPTSDDIHGIVQRLCLYTEYYLIKFQVYYSKLTTDVCR